MLKMATLSLKTDLHSLFERLNDSFAKMLVNLPGILKDILFQLLQSCGFVSVNTVFEMPPKEKVTWVEIRWVWWPFKCFLEADHISSKFVPYPASRGSSCVCRRTVLLKPLAFKVHISTPQSCHEFLHDCQVSAGGHSLGLSKVILEEEGANDATSANRHPHSTFNGMEWPFKDIVRLWWSPKDTMSLIDPAWEIAMGLVSKPDVVNPRWVLGHPSQELFGHDRSSLHITWGQDMSHLNNICFQWQVIREDSSYTFMRHCQVFSQDTAAEGRLWRCVCGRLQDRDVGFWPNNSLATRLALVTFVYAPFVFKFFKPILNSTFSRWPTCFELFF